MKLIVKQDSKCVYHTGVYTSECQASTAATHVHSDIYNAFSSNKKLLDARKTCKNPLSLLSRER